jgi:hypothetical protein
MSFNVELMDESGRLSDQPVALSTRELDVSQFI